MALEPNGRLGKCAPVVSQTVRDAPIGSNIAWASRGHHHLKGVPGEWQLFAIEN